MEILTVLNDYNAKNREEIHLTPFFYFLFWLEINIIIFLFSQKLQSVGPVEQLINLEWPYSLVTQMKESCMYLSGQLFFKTPNKTLKFQVKFKKNVLYSNLQT